MSMRRCTIVGTGLLRAVAILAALAASPAAADVKAAFLAGTYTATASDCKMVQALAAGTPRNLNTVPVTLDATGLHSWEGGCTFTRIRADWDRKTWRATARCGEGAITGVTDSITLVRTSPTAFTIRRASDKKAEAYSLCTTP